jgi:hypothetical protein
LENLPERHRGSFVLLRQGPEQGSEDGQRVARGAEQSLSQDVEIPNRAEHLRQPPEFLLNRQRPLGPDEIAEGAERAPEATGRGPHPVDPLDLALTGCGIAEKQPLDTARQGRLDRHGRGTDRRDLRQLEGLPGLAIRQSRHVIAALYAYAE